MNQQTVLITGAARGIGKTLAECFAARGYRVFANYHTSLEPLRLTAERLAARGFLLTPVPGDVADKRSVTAMLRQTGGVDILINNAGIAQIKEFTAITEEDWDKMLAVNLKGAYLCAQEALPHMIKQKAGCIINISSVWGVTGGSCEVHYSAAKAGLIGFTKALAKELGPSGIRVNCIAPGIIDTAMNSALAAEDLQVLRENTPLGRLGSPEDVARAALFLAKADFVTGQVINIDGGFHI